MPSDAANADLNAEVVIVGGGIVGLAIAAAIAERRASVVLMTTATPGAASRAAAGLLVPHYSREEASNAPTQFMTAGRDAYPAYVRWLEDRSGMHVPFAASGALEVAGSAGELATLHATAPEDAERLTSRAVAELEPALAPVAGGVLYPRDGAVDNVALADALALVVDRAADIRTVPEPAERLAFGRTSATAISDAGTRVRAASVVLAAGAWSGTIAGLPRPVPVRPLRGQICVLRSAPLRHVVLTRGAYGAYLVSRGGDRTLIGSTMEDVGFAVGTTPGALDGLRSAAATACPALGSQPVVAAWSGLRPATPDLLPILGPDPEVPQLLYACGHSRSGILLAPISAAVTCALALREPAPADLSPFSIARFEQLGGRRNP